MTKKELKAKCKDPGIDISGLDTNPKLEAAIEAKEAELAKAEAAEKEAAEKEAAEKEAAEKEAAEKEAAEKEAAEKEAAEKEAAEKESAEKEAKAKAAAKTKKEAVATYEDDRGRKWIFKKSAPKTLNIDGHPMSQKEILETEEVASELVYGNSAHLTQIHD